jgi:hypothetical protein
VDSNFICLITAAIVYGGCGILAMRIADRSLSKKDREAEEKGYFRKRDTPDPEPPETDSDPHPPPNGGFFIDVSSRAWFGRDPRR